MIHFAPANDFGSAYFGGPLQQSFSGARFGPEPLHRIFTFSPGGLPQPNGHNLQGQMSLFYGMRFSGCVLRYRVSIKRGVNAQYVEDYLHSTEIESILPAESSVDWPYTGYPSLLPYVPLEEIQRSSIEPQAFAERYTWQGLEDLTDNELVVVVPAIASFGVSMWGRSGDQEAVQLVFRYSYETQKLCVSNQCT